jgi:hypothetical protein
MVSFLSHPAIPKLPVELTGSEQDMEAMVFLRHISRMLIASGFPVTTNTWLVGGGGLVGTSFSWHHDPSPNHVGFILKVFTNAGFDHPLLLTNNNVMENTLRIQIGTKPMMGNLDLPPEQ